MKRRHDYPTIKVPEPYRGLWRIFRGHTFVAWLTFRGWEPRYLLWGDAGYASVPGAWMSVKQFGALLTGQLDEYRVEDARVN